MYRYFVDQKPIWEEQTDLIFANNENTVDRSIAQYTGGYILVSFICCIEIFVFIIKFKKLVFLHF